MNHPVLSALLRAISACCCQQAFIAWAALLTAAISIAPAQAQEFAVIASPPRFELTTKPGKTVRDVIEITNESQMPANYTVKSADWTLDRNAGVAFADMLQAGSCRPWLAIERKELTVPGRSKYRYRYEVTPPADLLRGECRFALLIEGSEQTIKTASGIAFPVSGRVGVIVYVKIGESHADLQVLSSSVVWKDNEKVPVITVKNNGDAHGRLSGFLSGTDANGKNIEFVPATLPILPGETRAIELTPNKEGNSRMLGVAYPIVIRGKLEWDNQSLPFEQRFAP